VLFYLVPLTRSRYFVCKETETNHSNKKPLTNAFFDDGSWSGEVLVLGFSMIDRLARSRLQIVLG
jgi:hypothetical protein